MPIYSKLKFVSLRQPIVAASIVALAVAGAVVVGVIGSQSLNSEREGAMHTGLVISELRALQSVMHDLEAGYVGYLSTGNDHALELYQMAESHMKDRLRFLETASAGNANQAEQVFRLVLSIGKLDAGRQKAIEERRQNTATRQNAVLELELSREIQNSIQQIEREQNIALENRFESFRQTNRQTVLFTRALIAIALLSIALLAFFIVRYRKALNNWNELRTKAEAREREVARRIMENAPIGIVRLDNRLTIIEANRAFCARLNLPQEQVIGSSLSGIFPSLSDELNYRVIAEGLPLKEENCPLTFPDRPEWQLTYWNLLAWPIRDEKGATREIVMLAMEISDRIRLMYERDDLYAALAHDLKTPVIATGRVLDLILSGQMTANEQRFFLGKVKENNEDLFRRIMNLLEVSRYQESADQVVIEPFDLVPVIRDGISQMNYLAEQRGMRISSELGDRLLIHADKTAIGRLLTNLLDNAIKYASPASSISVMAACEQDQILIEVRNSGPGIPMEVQSRLFQRFWQGLPGRQNPTSTGLGLYLCRKIVEAHNGSITCVSEPDKWTSFRVLLPAPLDSAGCSQPAPDETIGKAGEASVS